MCSSSPTSTICLVEKSLAVHSVSSICRSKAFNESFWMSSDARRNVRWLFRYALDTKFPPPPARFSSPSGYGWSLVPQTLFLGSPQRGLSNEPRCDRRDALAVSLCALCFALQGDSLISFIYSVCKYCHVNFIHYLKYITIILHCSIALSIEFLRMFKVTLSQTWGSLCVSQSYL